MLHATHDSKAIAANARKGFNARFEREARAGDPDGLLSDTEISRRAELLRKAHFLRLALKSAQSRRKRSERVASRGSAA